MVGNPNEHLKEIKLFDVFRPEEIAELSQLGEHKKAEPFANVVIEGEQTWGLYIVLEGQVGVYKSGQLSPNVFDIGQIGKGGFFGEMSLVDSNPRSATVRALIPCEFFFISRESFERFLAQGDRKLRFYENCVRLLFGRLRELNDSYVISQYHLWRVALVKPGEAA